MNAGQKQWRHGFITGLKRANEIAQREGITILSTKEAETMLRDHMLVSVTRQMGAFNRETRPGGVYWHGTEQAFEILNEMLADN